MHWHENAACLAEDPVLFDPFGTTGPALDQTERAKAVCSVCPVTAPCLAYALASRQDLGVWVGLAEDERARPASRRFRRRSADGARQATP